MDPPPSAWRKARDLISSSDNLAVDVMIQVLSYMCPLKPILIPAVYKHLNFFQAKHLRFVAGIRNIQQRRHLYLWSF